MCYCRRWRSITRTRGICHVINKCALQVWAFLMCAHRCWPYIDVRFVRALFLVPASPERHSMRHAILKTFCSMTTLPFKPKMTCLTSLLQFLSYTIVFVSYTNVCSIDLLTYQSSRVSYYTHLSFCRVALIAKVYHTRLKQFTLWTFFITRRHPKFRNLICFSTLQLHIIM